MRWIRLAAPLFLAVGSYGLNSCFTDDACSSGSTTLGLKKCNLTDEDVSDLAACFDSAGRGTIKSVKLHYNNITTLPPDIFDGLEALTRLYLPYNDFSLQAGNFEGAPALEILHLAHNGITSVPGDAFDGLSSLKSLFLNNNDIVSLEAGIFSGAPALEFLDLEANCFTTLPEGVFDGIGGYLTKLYLQSNELSELPTGVLKDLTSLKTLSLQENAFATLPAGFLEGLVSLENLYLASNDLISLPVDLCQSTPSLDRLTLGDNGIELLIPGTFDGCGNLTDLRLDDNKLAALPEDIFHDLASLEYLNIRGNELSTLPATIFDGNPALRKLYLSENQLAILPLCIFDATPALYTLNLESNVGMTLPAGLFDGLTSLAYLYLSDNEHVSVPTGVFDGLVALKTLHLDGNNLTTLPAGLFDDLESLVYLWLTENEDLQCVPETGCKSPERDAEKLKLDDDEVEESGICECPEEPTCDEDGNACDCQPGDDGFSCGTASSSSSEVIRAVSCSSPVPPTGFLVDAAERTAVGVEASGFDERTSGYGCSPAGCTADNTRDGNLDENSRWSCKGDLFGEDGGLCCIEYSFDDPQNIVTIEIAFYNGTEETRTLTVYDNNETHSQIQSSGYSAGYQEFALNTEETVNLRLCLDDPDSNGDDWLSITEVQFMVK